jgi:hypothetical protein
MDGLSLRQIAERHNVSTMAISYSIKRAMQHMHLHSMLPPQLTEQAFRESHELYIDRTIKRSYDRISLLQRRTQVLWSYWQTTSVSRTAQATGTDHKYVTSYIDGLIEVLAADTEARILFDAWIILRDNKGLRDKERCHFKR